MDWCCGLHKSAGAPGELCAEGLRPLGLLNLLVAVASTARSKTCKGDPGLLYEVVLLNGFGGNWNALVFALLVR